MNTEQIRLVRGTLNLVPIGKAARFPQKHISLKPWVFFAPRNGLQRKNGYNPRLYPAYLISGICCIRVWTFVWFQDPLVTGQFEVIAEVNLRSALNLKDGDEVTLEFENMPMG